MSTLLVIARLRQSLRRLKALGHLPYVEADVLVLREVLALTIIDLQVLYPDNLSTQQRHQLLQNLDFLEHQQVLIMPNTPPRPAFATWLALHHALLASIETTLTDEVSTHC